MRACHCSHRNSNKDRRCSIANNHRWCARSQMRMIQLRSKVTDLWQLLDGKAHRHTRHRHRLHHSKARSTSYHRLSPAVSDKYHNNIHLSHNSAGSQATCRTSPKNSPRRWRRWSRAAASMRRRRPTARNPPAHQPTLEPTRALTMAVRCALRRQRNCSDTNVKGIEIRHL